MSRDSTGRFTSFCRLGDRVARTAVATGDDLGADLVFEKAASRVVEMKLAISCVSTGNARGNLDREAGETGFDQVLAERWQRGKKSSAGSESAGRATEGDLPHGAVPLVADADGLSGRQPGLSGVR